MKAEVQQLLSQKQRGILELWFDRVVATYPPETVRLLKKERNPFANPVGSTLRKGLEGVLQAFLVDPGLESAATWLDRVVRIRAVQDFSPSAAVAFTFQLKDVIRTVCAEEIRDQRVTADHLFALDARIDRLALLGFDIYTACREKIHEIRVTEVKHRTHRLLERANMVWDRSEREADLENGNTLTP
jgi:hypothetical protein